MQSMKAKYKVDVLRAARLKKGWTMTELARRIGVTTPVISRMEDGLNQSPKTVARVAMEFGIKVEALVK